MLVGSSIEGVIESHISVERIVFRRSTLTSNAVIQWHLNLSFIREELTKLKIGGETVSGIVVSGARCYAFFESSESFADVFACGIDASEVRKLYIEIALCSPSASILRVEKSHFIDPHLSALLTTGQISYTNNHGLYLSERRISENGNLILRIVIVISGKFHVVRCSSLSLSHVTSLLQGSKQSKTNIEHILFRPYFLTVGEGISAVFRAFRRWSELQWYLILIVIALIVGTKTNEKRKLIVLEISDIML